MTKVESNDSIIKSVKTTTFNPDVAGKGRKFADYPTIVLSDATWTFRNMENLSRAELYNLATGTGLVVKGQAQFRADCEAELKAERTPDMDVWKSHEFNAKELVSKAMATELEKAEKLAAKWSPETLAAIMAMHGKEGTDHA